jgi:hypothetical protein
LFGTTSPAAPAAVIFEIVSGGGGELLGRRSSRETNSETRERKRKIVAPPATPQLRLQVSVLCPWEGPTDGQRARSRRAARGGQSVRLKMTIDGGWCDAGQRKMEADRGGG